MSATPAESESAIWRNEARKILASNTPAHIELDCLFLGHARMEHFHRLYRAWAHALHRGLPHQLSKTSRKLQRFLLRQGPIPDSAAEPDSLKPSPDSPPSHPPFGSSASPSLNAGAPGHGGSSLERLLTEVVADLGLSPHAGQELVIADPSGSDAVPPAPAHDQPAAATKKPSWWQRWFGKQTADSPKPTTGFAVTPPKPHEVPTLRALFDAVIHEPSVLIASHAASRAGTGGADTTAPQPVTAPPAAADPVATPHSAAPSEAPGVANRANLPGFRRRRQSPPGSSESGSVLSPATAPAFATAPGAGQSSPIMPASVVPASALPSASVPAAGQATAAAASGTATLPGTVKSAPPGALGFDTDTVLSASTAAAFVADGAVFAVRYLSRTTPEAAGDLSAAEAKDILAAGLALMAVQHVSQSGWTPNQSLGTQYGNAAAANAQQVGLPTGVVLWLDLEGVASGTDANAITDYCNAWFASVSAAGYLPGTYIGANCGLTGDQIYYGLLCEYYWQSGSRVPAVPVRGYCMVQTISQSYVFDGVAYDQNTIQADSPGDTPIWLAPAGAVA